MKRLNKFLLAGGGITVLLLAQCDWIRADTSMLLFPSKDVNFPLGGGKTVNYFITSWISKPYNIKIKNEFSDSGKALSFQKISIPYNISFKCFHFFDGKNVLIYRGNAIDYFNYNGRYWKPKNSEYVSGRSYNIGGLRLSAGKYRCEFEDKSPFEMKKELDKAGIVRTYVEISPYSLFIY